MVETIAAAITGGAVALGAAFAYGRISYWEGMYHESVNELKNIIDRLASAERTAQLIADKYATVVEFSKLNADKPVVAALTDQQVQQIASVLAHLVLKAHSLSPLN